MINRKTTIGLGLLVLAGGSVGMVSMLWSLGNGLDFEPLAVLAASSAFVLLPIIEQGIAASAQRMGKDG